MGIKKVLELGQDELINPLVEIMEKVSNDVIGVIASRIGSNSELNASSIHKLTQLIRRSDLDEIERLLSVASKKSIPEIDRILEESAKNNDDLAKELYKYRNIEQVSGLSTNMALKSAIDTARKNMLGNVLNLSKTTAFLDFDGKPSPIATVYNNIINKSAYEIQSGLTDYHTSMRNSIKSLANSGLQQFNRDENGRIQVVYQSGNTRRLGTAVRSNILESVSRFNTEYRAQQGLEFGADGIELSAHGLCAPDHINFQGRQFSNSEFESIQNSLKRKFFTNGCKHTQFPIINGISTPVYSNGDLSQIKKNSEEQTSYTDLLGNKKTVTKYDFSQKQRNVETSIRRLKDQKYALETSQDTVGAKQLQQDIASRTRYYKQMSEQGGLAPELKRLTIIK